MKIPALKKINEYLISECYELGITGRKKWNKAIFELFDNMEQKPPNHYCYYRGGENGEYLVDCCWADETYPENWDETARPLKWCEMDYRGLTLAVECELNGHWHDIMYDFFKLVDVSAKRKVFIGSLIKKEIEHVEIQTRMEAIKFFLSHHNKCCHQNEEYLVILLPQEKIINDKENVYGFSFLVSKEKIEFYDHKDGNPKWGNWELFDDLSTRKS